MTAPDLCPLCGADLTGEPIPDSVLMANQRLLYGGHTHYTRAIGMTARIVGEPGSRIATYLCPDCNGTWPAEGQQK